MYINRRTFNTKRGKQREAIALLLEAQALIPEQPMRVIVPVFGTFDTLAVEFDFATLVDYERFWAELWIFIGSTTWRPCHGCPI